MAKIFHWEAKEITHPPPPVQILLCLFIACQTGTINTKPMVYTGVSLYHPSSSGNGQILTGVQMHAPKKVPYPLIYKVSLSDLIIATK